jgi:hypothetical protein
MKDKTIKVFQRKRNENMEIIYVDENGERTNRIEEDIPIDSILDLNLRLLEINSNSRSLGLRPLYLDVQNREFYLSGKQFSKFIFEGLPVNYLNGKFKFITRGSCWFIELIQQ